MNLYKNGFVVAELKCENSVYKAWPLSELRNDENAVKLTDEADDIWFLKYDMQMIVPDINYIKRYADYCGKIGLNVKVLLFESPDDKIVIDDKAEICEVLGFDCIGTVNYSYLQEEFDESEPEYQKRNIALNKHGLLDKLEDVLFFIKLRKEVIASGVNLEDFWEELPVRISVINDLIFSL